MCTTYHRLIVPTATDKQRGLTALKESGYSEALGSIILFFCPLARTKLMDFDVSSGLVDGFMDLRLEDTCQTEWGTAIIWFQTPHFLILHGSTVRSVAFSPFHSLPTFLAPFCGLGPSGSC